jgi:molybdenum cofactor biosynthesis enzyme
VKEGMCLFCRSTLQNAQHCHYSDGEKKRMLDVQRKQQQEEDARATAKCQVAHLKSVDPEATANAMSSKLNRYEKIKIWSKLSVEF